MLENVLEALNLNHLGVRCLPQVMIFFTVFMVKCMSSINSWKGEKKGFNLG